MAAQPSLRPTETAFDRKEAAAMQCKRTAISSFVAVVMLASVAARASEVSFEQASKTADEIDAELVKLRTETDAVSSAYGTSDTAGVSKVDRRLREAEIHALLGDHLRAAIVLFDVAEDEVSRSHPRYEDCIVLLAESLRKSGSPSSAKRYYEELLSSGTPERIDDIVLGLLEIAGETNSLEDVDRYFALLKQSGSMSRPDLDYIYGKMLFRGAGNDFSTLDRARQSFEAVPVGHAISGQASYYAGVSLVRMGRYQEAILGDAAPGGQQPRRQASERARAPVDRTPATRARRCRR